MRSIDALHRYCNILWSRVHIVHCIWTIKEIIMSIYTDRWNAVHELFMTKIVPALDDPTCDVLFDGQKIERCELIIDERISIVIENCTYVIYNPDPDFDEGAHDTIEETAQRIRRDFKIYKRIDF